MGFLARGKFFWLVKSLYTVFIAGFALFICYILAVNFNLFWLFGKMPSADDLDNPKSQLASEVISSDGKVLGKFLYENRSPVEFEEIPPHLIDALIATEDVRFTRHGGIDARSMLRVVTGVLTLNPKGGGSTITQQLAKNLFKIRRDESYEGLLHGVPILGFVIIKTKEWITAVKLERKYTKKEIMKMYLDTIEFSSGAHGLKSAAKTYFSKLPQELNLLESATLVGMIQNPSRFNPKFHPQASTTRRNTVLAQMVRYGKLAKDDFDQLSIEEISLKYSPDSHNNGPAPYFREFLKDWAKKEIEKLGYEPEDIYTKGFKIYTTIDSRMQKYAEDAVEEHMTQLQQTFYKHWGNRNPWVQRRDANSSASYVEIPDYIENIARKLPQYKSLSKKFNGDEKKIFNELNKKNEMTVYTIRGERDTLFSTMDSIRYYKKFLNMGFMAMDPRNGNIKAWVGGINFRYFKYDHVQQSTRQPGSTFKPFVYVTAIDNGFSTCEQLVDEPVTFGAADGVSGPSWTPKNSTGKYSYQSLSLRRALGLSVNSISAKLIKQFKPSNVINMAHQLGIKSKLDNSPSLCLGVSDVSLYEMLSAYAVFANGGKYTEPLFVMRIEDKHGVVLKEYLPDQKEVLSAESAYKMVHLMTGSTEVGGTSQGLARFGILDGNQVAGKTGTTSNYSDGWFMGLTSNLIGGAWAGGEERAVHFRSIEYGQGARMAMPAFGMFMKKVYADPKLEYKKSQFEVPEGLRISGDCVMSPNDSYYSTDAAPSTLKPAVIKPKDEEEML